MLNTQRHTQIIPMTDAVVARGQRAWGRIKATAAEQRELWREVGELKQNVIETVHELELAGLSREAIAAVFINVAKTLKEE